MMVISRTILCVAMGIYAGYPCVAAPNLTYQEARQLVLKNNRHLLASDKRLQAAEAGVELAAFLPNTQIDIAAENLGQNQIEATVSQQFELGGKRRSRIEQAKISGALVSQEKQATLLAVESELIRRCAVLLAAQARLAEYDSILARTEALKDQIQRLMAAGKGSEADLLRAEIEIDEIRLQERSEEDALISARENLTALWAGDPSSFGRMRAQFAQQAVVPGADTIIAYLDRHPVSRLSEFKRTMAVAETRAVHAGAWPDLGLSAGLIRNREDNGRYPVIGASLTLPLFTKNKAALRSAHLSVQAVEAQTLQDRDEREVAVRALVRQYQTLSLSLALIDSSILPKTLLAVEKIQQRYGMGGSSYFEVRESQKAFFDVQVRRINLVLERALLAADIGEQTGYQITIFSDE